MTQYLHLPSRNHLRCHKPLIEKRRRQTRWWLSPTSVTHSKAFSLVKRNQNSTNSTILVLMSRLKLEICPMSNLIKSTILNSPATLQPKIFFTSLPIAITTSISIDHTITPAAHVYHTTTSSVHLFFSVIHAILSIVSTKSS